jgi:hypothetical protein
MSSTVTAVVEARFQDRTLVTAVVTVELCDLSLAFFTYEFSNMEWPVT